MNPILSPPIRSNLTGHVNCQRGRAGPPASLSSGVRPISRFAMSNAKLDQLMESLRSASTQTVQGVVYPSGVGVSRSQGDELWHMTFSLAAWCIADGPIRHDRLLVRKNVADGEINNYRGQLPDYGVIALDLGIVESIAFPGLPALLHQIHPHQTCRPGIFEIAQAMRRPVTSDPITPVNQTSATNMFG